jgi:hypothetical protein
MRDQGRWLIFTMLTLMLAVALALVVGWRHNLCFEKETIGCLFRQLLLRLQI